MSIIKLKDIEDLSWKPYSALILDVDSKNHTVELIRLVIRPIIKTTIYIEEQQ